MVAGQIGRLVASLLGRLAAVTVVVILFASCGGRQTAGADSGPELRTEMRDHDSGETKNGDTLPSADDIAEVTETVSDIPHADFEGDVDSGETADLSDLGAVHLGFPKRSALSIYVRLDTGVPFSIRLKAIGIYQEYLVDIIAIVYHLACETQGSLCDLIFEDGEFSQWTKTLEAVAYIMEANLTGIQSEPFVLQPIRLNTELSFADVVSVPAAVAASETMHLVPTISVPHTCQSGGCIPGGACVWTTFPLEAGSGGTVTFGGLGQYLIVPASRTTATFAPTELMLEVPWGSVFQSHVAYLMAQNANIGEPLQNEVSKSIFLAYYGHLIGGRECQSVEECCDNFVLELAGAVTEAELVIVATACHDAVLQAGTSMSERLLALNSESVPMRLSVPNEGPECQAEDTDSDGVLDVLGDVSDVSTMCVLHMTEEGNPQAPPISLLFVGEGLQD